jgi:hypothetical protein
MNLLHHRLILGHLAFAGCCDVLLLQPVAAPQILRSSPGHCYSTAIKARNGILTLYMVYRIINVFFRGSQEELYAIQKNVYLIWVRSYRPCKGKL